MPSPIAAVRPTSPPGDFAATLRATLEDGGAGPRPVSGSVSGEVARPDTVSLGRMLAVLGGSTGAAAPVAHPATEPAAAVSSAETDGVSEAGAVVARARNYLGVPYRWGGSDPATGFDCSGLVQQVFDDLGVSVPRTSAQQATVGSPVRSVEDARPGDLLFWASSRPGQANHIGIYVGDGQMLHAPYTGEVVKVAPVRSTPPSAIRRVALG